jgi:flagellar basal body-associated protein FliL
MFDPEETEKAKQATKKRNTIEITLVVLAILALAALFFYMHLARVLDSLH